MLVTVRTGMHVMAFCMGVSLPFIVLKDHQQGPDLDEKVKTFLMSDECRWRDASISASDGKALHDLIMANNYKQALEIGTSTGHSAIWIAWALSKTGGKLTTIETNEQRHQQALEDFEKAGLSEFIDARLVDAHEPVTELEGPYDFIFIDTNADQYPEYIRMLLPKLRVGGCLSAHNVLDQRMSGVSEFLKELRNTPDLETKILRSSGSGLTVSFKRDVRSRSGHRVVRPSREAVSCGSS